MKDNATRASPHTASDENWFEASNGQAIIDLKRVLKRIGSAIVKTAGDARDPIIFYAKLQLSEEKLIKDIKSLGQEMTPAQRRQLLWVLNNTLWCAYVLGTYSTPSKSILDLYASQARRQQSSRARDALAASNSERQKRLKDAILSVSGLEAMKASEKFARIIRPKVLACLGEDAGQTGWPSWSAIKAAIRELKLDKSDRLDL